MVLHENEGGFLPGLVAGVWAAWPFLHQARVQRYNFLHPVPREYKVHVKQAFSKVRDLLADTSYNFGDKWHIGRADTTSGRITADLRFTDEQVHHDIDARGHIHCWLGCAAGDLVHSIGKEWDHLQEQFKSKQDVQPPDSPSADGTGTHS